MTTWLLENPSSQMSTCAQKQEAEEGDVTELYMNSRGLCGKERLAFISAKPPCPLHSLLCSSSTFLRCAPTPVAVKMWLLPPGWTLGSSSPQSQSLLTILGKAWFQQHAGRASASGNSGWQTRAQGAESTGANGHVQGQVHTGTGHRMLPRPKALRPPDCPPGEGSPNPGSASTVSHGKKGDSKIQQCALLL